MKIAATLLFLAVVCLTASSLVWVRATNRSAAMADGASGAAMLEDLERTTRDAVVVDVAARYAGRSELFDPRSALPTWHAHARDDAARVHLATKQCPPVALPSALADASLGKAYAWHERTCAGGAPSDELVDRPPFIHPSGRSYALLALGQSSSAPAAWARAHVRAFHVLELSALDPSALDAADLALSEIPASAWEGLARGDHVVLTRASLLIANHGPLGLAKLRVVPLATWEAFSRGAALALVPRGPIGACAQPASPDLCWEPRTPAERHRSALLACTVSSAVVAFGALSVLAFAYVGERRRLHRDRIHVLRTLTHELRTPATSLRLDIEPLRNAYDELPPACQEPLLRLSNGIERLHRVLHRSARYMALFETNGSAASLVALRDVPSCKTMFDELADEWPEGVSLAAAPADGAITTDVEWLGVAVRNLVENAARHGVAPVEVSWRLDAANLVVRVADAGETPKLSLHRVTSPHARDEKSAGLGLGLAIVDRIARLLGGRLTHEPSPTTFELRIPSRRGGASS